MSGERFDVVSPVASSWGERPGESVPASGTDVIFSGSYGEVLDHFDTRLWTDGLPIVPPTVASVEQMCAGVDRVPTEVLGTVAPDEVDVTVWNTAVNGVMAGCQPADLPVLLEVVTALSHPAFRLADAGSTTGWEPLVVLSGPDLDERGFNTRGGVMRVGRRANTSVGRFVRLWMRNIAGFRIPPGITDMCALGQGLLPAMAENDDASREVGWPLWREELGFASADTVVAVQSVVGTSLPIYTTGSDAEPHLRVLAEQLAACSGYFSATGVMLGSWSPLLAMSPAVAEVLARRGMCKDDVRASLAERAVAPAHWLEYCAQGLWNRPVDLAGLVRDGTVAARYHESDDPFRLVPAIPEPDSLAIVLTGEPARTQSKYYVPIGGRGERVVRVVRW